MLEGPLIKVDILPKVSLDHWLVQFWVEKTTTLKFKPFCFEKFSLTHPDFSEISRTWWANAEIEHGTQMYKFQHRLKKFKL
jgi:hypothetical protein